MGGEISWQGVLILVGSVVAAWLTYKGARFTARLAREGSQETTKVDEQQSALDAWKELLEPYRERIVELGRELGNVRQDLADERRERAAKERKDARDRETARKRVQEQVDKLTERIDLQAEQIKHWKRLARVMAHFATAMRDEVLRLGGTVPATPDELLLIQSLDEDDHL